MGKFEKQPYEEFTVTSDFSRNFATGESIATQHVSACDSLGGDVSNSVIDQNTVASDGNGIVSVLVRGGDEAHSPYKLTFRCQTTAGHKWENDIMMKVRDR